MESVYSKRYSVYTIHIFFVDRRYRFKMNVQILNHLKISIEIDMVAWLLLLFSFAEKIADIELV